MKLKSRNALPINGWQFYQAETGWSVDPWRSFSETVGMMIAHRQANPRFKLATDIPTVEEELEQYTVSRLSSIPGGAEYLLNDGGAAPPVFISRHRLRNRVAGAVGSASNMLVGASVLKDWLGDGLRPVERAEAESRAAVCARCPQNVPGSALVGLAAETFRKLVETKHGMRLVTAHDQKLETCAACSCRLTLKVWAPREHILNGTTDEVRSKLWSECWITRNKFEDVYPTNIATSASQLAG